MACGCPAVACSAVTAGVTVLKVGTGGATKGTGGSDATPGKAAGKPENTAVEAAPAGTAKGFVAGRAPGAGRAPHGSSDTGAMAGRAKVALAKGDGVLWVTTVQLQQSTRTRHVKRTQ